MSGLASIITMADVKPEPVKWLWQDRIPLGKLTTLAGDPGLGKSLITLEIAARISTERPFWDGAQSLLGDTLIMTTEDDPEDTIRPRLDACFADCSRIHFFDHKVDPSGKESLPDLRELSAIDHALATIRTKGGIPRLMIVDPIEAHLAGSDAHTNAEVREILSPLAKFARKQQIAIVTVQHLNKSPGPAAYRVGGSIAFTAASRAVWIVTREEEDESLRLMLPLKMNLAADVSGLSYRIKIDSEGVPFPAWEGIVNKSAREVLSGKDVRRVAPLQSNVVEYLKYHGPSDSKEIADALQTSQSSIGNALSKLRHKGVVEEPDRFRKWRLKERSYTAQGPTETDENGEISEESRSPSEAHSPLSSNSQESRTEDAMNTPKNAAERLAKRGWAKPAAASAR